MSNNTPRPTKNEFHIAPLCQCGCGQPVRIAKKPSQQARYLPKHHQKCSKGTIEERFWSKVDKNGPNGCWVWNAMLSKGYGKFKYRGKMSPAPRVAWELTNGPIPDGLFVCHDCPDGDNPRCVNPAHMFLGTPKDNTQDMIKKGRSRNARGEAQGNAKLDDARVLEIRELYAGGSVTQAQLADMFDVKAVTVHAIVTGRTWTHVGGAITKNRVGENVFRSYRLTGDDVRVIRRRHAAGGVLYRELAEEFGVDQSTIGSIIRRDTWKDV